MLKTLLMIDDDQDDREMFKEGIEKCKGSVEVLFANDGVEAFEMLNSLETLPDAIFLDYNMPKMNGAQCLQKLRRNNRTEGIIVVMYTTSGNRSHEEGILLLGADYYMRKTNSFNQFCIELERLLFLIDRKLQPRRKPEIREIRKNENSRK